MVKKLNYHVACILGRCGIAALLLLLASAGPAFADAIVVTRAMLASTIVEVFVEEDQVRLEVEFGAADAAAFVNALPDVYYAKVTGQARPLAERSKTFLESDWRVQADGRTLSGRIERFEPGKRIVRDDVTGEPLPTQPEDAEPVIRLTLLYPLEGRPRSLRVRPPLNGNDVAANIGFVCYHQGLPINDFRYLPGEVTLDLDWDDPWYSRFHNRNLRRQFDTPLSTYLYVEPYEVRKEIIVRPKDLQGWVDLDLADDGVIPAEAQADLKRRVAAFLAEKNPLWIDGERVDGRLDRIHFIHRTLRATGIIEPAVDLEATAATLGVIFVYPVDQLPEKVAMKWELFSPKIQIIPAVASDEAGGLPAKLTPSEPLLEWNNYLTQPTSTQLRTVASPPAAQSITIPLISLMCSLLGVVMLALLLKGWFRGAGGARWVIGGLLVSISLGVLSLSYGRIVLDNPFATSREISVAEAEKMLPDLLHNVYRSFDHHDGGLIYDRLAQSIAGEMLEQVYLETRKSMEIKNQGGLRVSVKDVNVTELEQVDQDGGAPTFRCRWRVSGWIGHWGHIHRRENEHVALLTITARDARWKITDMEMLDVQALAPANSPGLRQ